MQTKTPPLTIHPCLLEGEAEEAVRFIVQSNENIRATGTSEGIDQGFKEMGQVVHVGPFVNEGSNVDMNNLNNKHGSGRLPDVVVLLMW